MARGLRGGPEDAEEDARSRRSYPRLAELGDGGLEQLTTTREFHARFDFGLEVIMNGLRAARRRKRTRPEPKSKPKAETARRR